MDKFTVEEINLMCVFEGQDRTGMIAEIKNIISSSFACFSSSGKAPSAITSFNHSSKFPTCPSLSIS